MVKTKRSDNRPFDRMRPVSVKLNPQPYAEGSVIIKTGRTEVLAAVSVLDDVPGWLAGRGRGWLTAQYAMLPRATSTRNPRPGYDGEVKGRSREIQRLIGRALRAGLDMELLGERLLKVDCDVLVADGGTRCASITGAWLAVRLAVDGLLDRGVVHKDPIISKVCAISAGIVNGELMLDLAADEDQRADADFNFVFTGPGELVEIQGTGEKTTFSWPQAQTLFELASGAAEELFNFQNTALGMNQ